MKFIISGFVSLPELYNTMAVLFGRKLDLKGIKSYRFLLVYFLLDGIHPSVGGISTEVSS